MNVVWLTGMPRSGTTWVSQFFAASPHIRVKFCPLFSYAFKNTMTEKNDADSWRAFFKRVYETNDDYMDQTYLSRNDLIPETRNKDVEPGTLLIKSNRQHHLTETLMEKMTKLRMIALIRNPLAAISSWVCNPMEFPPDADPLQEWRTGSCRKDGVGEYWGFDDWKSVTLMHLLLEKKYPERFFIHTYEDIMREPYAQARLMYRQIGVQYDQSVDDFITKSRSRHVEHPRSVYKSNRKNDQWKQQLDRRIIDSIYNDLAGTVLEKFIDHRQ